MYVYIYIYIHYFYLALKKPQSHVANLDNYNYTWEKESCLQEMSVCNASKSFKF